MKWEDVRSLVNIADALFEDGGWNYDSEQEYYEEVLRRYRTLKNGGGKACGDARCGKVNA